MKIIGTDPVLTIYCCTVIFVTGAVFGSFLHCLAWRMVHGGSVLNGRSRCPECGHVLGPLELIPIFSWLFQKGKCRHCGGIIPARYPLSEIMLGLLSVLCLVRFDISWEFLRNLLFTYGLFTLSITDLDDCLIPDRILAAVVCVWVIFLPLSGTGTETGSAAAVNGALAAGWKPLLMDAGLHLLSAVVFGGGLLLVVLLFEKVIGREAMGGGDIKLIAVCTLYLGGVGALLMILLACLLGLVFAFATKYRKNNSEKLFPFGPAVSLAAWIVLLYGGPVISWYLALL